MGPELPDEPLLLLLDFDGTLVDIAPRPELVRVPPALPRTLLSLAASRHRVVIVTGRPAAQVRRHLAPAEPEIVGLHGLECPGQPLPPPHEQLVALRTRLEPLTERFPGLWIEDKGPLLAVHTRQVADRARDAAEAEVERCFAAAQQQAGPALRLLRGKRVWELRPASASKGNAVRRLCGEQPGRWPVYVGDDVTDEEAFAALPRGLSVRVGPEGVATRAHARLDDPQAVLTWLQSLVQYVTTHHGSAARS